MPLFTVDFIGGALGYRRVKGGGKNQAIARAVGLKSSLKPTVLDVTAGLGRDAFILASLGCEVHMIERSPVLAKALQAGLDRALQDPKIAEIIGRMTLKLADAKDILAGLQPDNYPDVIYIDPMFPEENKSALNKIEMRTIREIVGDDNDADLLLTLALGKAKKRVVVKRSRKALPLGGVVPSFVIGGKSSRYDVYLGSSTRNEQ
jgi:16S rRNA (guanine1516-N2)-methyltransferase